MTEAIIFVPRNDCRWRDLCFDYAHRHDYEVTNIVSVWDDVLKLILDGWRGVVVAGDPSHRPTNRLPRCEFVSEESGDVIPFVHKVARRRTRRVVRRWIEP